VSNAPLATVGAVGLMRAVEDHHLYGEYKVSSNTQTEFQKERKRERESKEITRFSRWKEIWRARARVERTQNGVYFDEFNLRVRKDEIVGSIVYACATREVHPGKCGASLVVVAPNSSLLPEEESSCT